MDDRASVRLIERTGDLGRDLEDLGEGNGTPLEPRCERLAVDIFHHQVADDLSPGRIVFACRTGRRCFADVKQGADVRVTQRRDVPSLPSEPFPEARVGCEMRGQEFNCDHAVESRVASAINLTHPARAKRRDDLVRAQASSGSKRHRIEPAMYYLFLKTAGGKAVSRRAVIPLQSQVSLEAVAQADPS
jgi:hypothetical protein